MFTKTISAGLVALLATSVSAQTHSACKPTEKDCPPAPALGKSITIDYTQGADKSNFFNIDAGTTLEYDGGNGAVFKITGDGQAPTLVSKQYIFFGRVDVELKAAPGKGIVTSVVLQSDDLDEIDWVSFVLDSLSPIRAPARRKARSADADANQGFFCTTNRSGSAATTPRSRPTTSPRATTRPTTAVLSTPSPTL
jgi:hypothetical protein